jgi:hypothetical protein
MACFVNVVGTRVLDGDHAAALRWYADHVHQLFAFPDLRAAVLYRQVARTPSTDAPQMLCLYDFGTAEAFEAYGRSAVFDAAARDRLQSWGRDGIEITSREQYLRLYRTVHGDGADVRGPWQVHAWSGATSAAAERALAADALARGAAAFTLLRAAKAAGVLTLECGAGTFAAAPDGLAPAWHGTYECLGTWTR